MAYAGGAAAAGSAAAVAAAIAQAVKASGAIVEVEPESFMALLAKADSPVVVMAAASWPGRGFRYLLGYKGFVFFTKSKSELMLPGRVELIAARKIWVP